jgi:tetratricopeptide (TPR) repeat protein
MFKAIFLLLLLILPASSTLAQTPGRDMEKEKAIVAELEALAPESVGDFKAATEAMDAQDLEKAVTLFQKVHDRVPDFDASLRRLGGCLVLTGKTKEGFAYLEQALEIRRSPENLLSLATSLAYPGIGKEGTRPQKVRAFELIREASRSLQNSNDPDYLICEHNSRWSSIRSTTSATPRHS